VGKGGIPFCDACGRLCIIGYLEARGKHFCFLCHELAVIVCKQGKRKPRAGGRAPRG
jgi:hypothetical protein